MARAIKPQEGPQTEFCGSEVDIIIFGGSAGGGKAQPLDEPVLTPFGFRPMGEIRVGDKVVSAHGKCATVIQVHPQGIKDIYRVKFIDGAETRCTGEHLWKAKKAREKNKRDYTDGWLIYDTDTLYKNIKKKNYLVPFCEPVQFTRGRRGGKIKPYTMGVLLGDGCLCGESITITNNDEDVFNRVREDGYHLSRYNTKDNEADVCGLVDFTEEKKYLKLHGLLCKSDVKHIPEGYKYGTIDERYALLQGLMDTDGYADDRGHCEFCTISKQLALDVQFVVRSLGGKATISEKDPVCVFPDGTKKVCAKAYIVYIRVSDNSRLFSLERKRQRCVDNPYNGGYEPYNRIVSIEPCGQAECQCITIDEPDGLYVTKDFIVTHNSWGILYIPLKYKNVPGFGMTIFRKNYNQIFAQGGLWDEASDMYSGIKGAQIHKGEGSWTFANAGGQSKVSFAHIERDEDLRSWQGSQIAGIGFDELTHFSEKIFFYMLSRNRSKCGVKPFVRATCNPDADSWVAKFISWWIDQDTGYPIPERSGVARWFIRRDETIHWANHKETLWKRFNLVTDEEKEEPKSVTFIMSSIYDNRELLRVNPQYLANLKALPEVDRERLLYGNWKIKPSAGLYFKRTQVEMLENVPSDIIYTCRGWDLAATEDKESKGDPDYTAGVLIGRRKTGGFVVLDVINQRIKAGDVEKLIKNTAVADKARWGIRHMIRLPQDPAAAGKIVAQTYIKALYGFSVKAMPVSGSKQLRANPFATQWQNGNVSVVVADWNDMYFSQLESFPDVRHDDMVDASADAFNEVAEAHFSLKNLL